MGLMGNNFYSAISQEKIDNMSQSNDLVTADIHVDSVDVQISSKECKMIHKPRKDMPSQKI